MQLMQQKVQKSRMTTLPRRSRRRKGLAVLSQFTPPCSSGARIRPSRAGSSALAAAPPLFSAGAWGAAGSFFSEAETSAAAFAGFSCNRPQPNKLPDANNTTTAISTTSRRPGTVDICVLLDKVRKRPDPSDPYFTFFAPGANSKTLPQEIIRRPGVANDSPDD